jgi:hypothetical protein
MALQARVTLHENPFGNLVVWEKKSPTSISKHRSRSSETLKTIDTIVIKSDNGKDEYHTDYCVLAAATKEPSSQHSRIRPVLVSDRDSRTNLSTASYNTFAKTHTSGPVYIQQSPTVTPKPRSQGPTRVGSNSPAVNNKYNDDEIKLFCCHRSVDSIIDYATCMCCVKGAIYHCTKDTYDEGNLAVDPCTCEQDPTSLTCISRWACMTLCSFFLPCVLCYLPAKGCVQVCTCYKRHRTASARRQRGRIKGPHWLGTPSLGSNEIKLY